MFEPFYRGSLAEQMVEGVGIGLTVVRDMVMALGGTVAVDSKKDHGSVFTITLPIKHNEGVKERLEDGPRASELKMPYQAIWSTRISRVNIMSR